REAVGYIGLSGAIPILPPERFRLVKLSPIDAIVPAISRTAYYTRMSFDMLRKMVLGKVSVRHLGGPISIAKGAGQSWRSGFNYFVGFLAIISISLAVLNMLPIPVLDGGHLLYYFLEWVLGRPLPIQLQLLGYRLGMIVLFGLMLIAFYNDIARL